MNTKEMQSIIELSKSLSFRETAEKLFMSQPALSYLVANVETEIGFKIFERKSKSVSLTPSGRIFVKDIETIYEQIFFAIERGQNFSSQYTKEIRIGLPRRSMFSRLPYAITEMNKKYPEIVITPIFTRSDLINEYQKGNIDIVIGDESDLLNVKDSKLIPLYQSKIKVVLRKDDSLAKLSSIQEADLKGRTMLVGSASRKNLRRLQLELEKKGIIKTLNSDSHDTTLTLVTAGKAICLSPAFYENEGGECAFIDFNTDVYIQISIMINEHENRKEIHDFIKILQNQANKN